MLDLEDEPDELPLPEDVPFPFPEAPDPPEPAEPFAEGSVADTVEPGFDNAVLPPVDTLPV